MERIAAGGPNTIKFERLRDIIKHNLSYLLFTRIRTLKADLSRSDVARLDVPEIDLEIELSRREFETMISEPLQRVAEALDVTVAKAGLRNHQVDIVLRTGGSSLIPAVRGLLEDRFPGRVVDHDPFTSVAAGLAIARKMRWHGKQSAADFYPNPRGVLRWTIGHALQVAQARAEIDKINHHAAQEKSEKHNQRQAPNGPFVFGYRPRQ
mgnify:CR=1 FL=1